MKELEDSKATKKAKEDELEVLTAEILDLRSLQISKDQELADLKKVHAGEREIQKAELTSLQKIFDALRSAKMMPRRKLKVWLARWKN